MKKTTKDNLILIDIIIVMGFAFFLDHKALDFVLYLNYIVAILWSFDCLFSD